MINFTVTFDQDNNIFNLEINGKEAAYLELGEGDNSCRQIGMVEINKALKGKGLYSSFLTAILQTGEIDQFYSDNRNEDSNSIWEHWTNEDLDHDDTCYVDLNTDGTLCFFSEKSL